MADVEDVKSDDGAEISEHAEGELKGAWIFDHKRWFRRPGLRIFVAWFVLFIDNWHFAEDPIPDSRVRYYNSILGPVYGLLLNIFRVRVGFGAYLLSVACLAVFVPIGMYVGRQWLHHKLLRDRLGW